MSKGNEVAVDAETTVGDAEGRCLVCGSGADVRQHSLTVGDGSAHTVSLCADHHGIVHRTATDRDVSLATTETRKVTVRVPSVLLEDVDRRASELEVPRSELIRDCLRDGLHGVGTDASAEDFLMAVVELNRRLSSLRTRLDERDGAASIGAGGADGAPAAANGETGSDSGADGELDVEFLKERVVELESLLELALKQ